MKDLTEARNCGSVRTTISDGATELGATIIWGDEFIKVEVDNYAEDLIYLSVSEGQLEAIIVDTNDQMPLDIKFEKVRKEKRDEST
tara:strand:- start:3 stop:260 length:258 start_codon:yes stop_codon:yes gene_type:complete